MTDPQSPRREVVIGRDGHTHIPISTYSGGNGDTVAMAVHGGCFQDGDETFNRAQSELWAQSGITVVQVGFRQTSPTETTIDLEDVTRHLRKKHGDPIGIIGCSSGGHYSVRLAAQPPDGIAYKFAIQLCSVNMPFLRYQYLKISEHPKADEMRAKQLAHFGSEECMEKADTLVMASFRALAKTPSLFIVADDDVNVPSGYVDGASMYYGAADRVVEIKNAGHELCYRADDRVCDVIVEWLAERKK